MKDAVSGSEAHDRRPGTITRAWVLLLLLSPKKDVKTDSSTKSKHSPTFLTSPQRRTHDFGGLNGLSLEGTPVSSGSLWAFCKQKVFRSAAACDTCIKHIKHRSTRATRRYLKGICITETDEEDLLMLTQMLQSAWTCRKTSRPKSVFNIWVAFQRKRMTETRTNMQQQLEDGCRQRNSWRGTGHLGVLTSGQISAFLFCRFFFFYVDGGENLQKKCPRKWLGCFRYEKVNILSTTTGTWTR